MKKIVSILLLMLISISMASCKETETEKTIATPTPAVTEPVQTPQPEPNSTLPPPKDIDKNITQSRIELLIVAEIVEEGKYYKTAYMIDSDHPQAGYISYNGYERTPSEVNPGYDDIKINIRMRRESIRNEVDTPIYKIDYYKHLYARYLDNISAKYDDKILTGEEIIDGVTYEYTEKTLNLYNVPSDYDGLMIYYMRGDYQIEGYEFFPVFFRFT